MDVPVESMDSRQKKIYMSISIRILKELVWLHVSIRSVQVISTLKEIKFIMSKLINVFKMWLMHKKDIKRYDK